MLHRAIHRFLLGGDCGSALDSQDDITLKSPLLFSGLVLADANHRSVTSPGEDRGILTVEEIATIDRSDTEWAVLSACETGRREIRNGEGVLSLQQAFRMAGARTIIINHWPVHDANLELLAGRHARGQSTHPSYWAGFIASLEWQ